MGGDHRAASPPQASHLCLTVAFVIFALEVNTHFLFMWYMPLTLPQLSLFLLLFDVYLCASTVSHLLVANALSLSPVALWDSCCCRAYF